MCNVKMKSIKEKKTNVMNFVDALIINAIKMNSTECELHAENKLLKEIHAYNE